MCYLQLLQLPTIDAGGTTFVVVPLEVAGAHGIVDDPAAERRRAVGERLRRAREHAGLTLAELAGKLGTYQPSVCACERAREYIGEERVNAWLAACGLPADWSPPKARARRRATKGA